MQVVDAWVMQVVVHAWVMQVAQRNSVAR